MKRIAVNARFLSQKITGVQRYARELLLRFGTAVDEIAPSSRLDGLTAHLWEQAVLPLRTGKRLLWSPTNTGPVSVSNQVVTIHDASALEHPEWFSPRFSSLYQFLIPKLLRRVQRVITDSEFSRERLLDLTGVPEERVVAIPCGVDSRFHPTGPEVVADLRRRLGLTADYVLVVGSLDPRKNLGRLFQAWELARLYDDGLQLAVAGGGGKSFGSVGFDRVPDGVKLLGYVQDEDLPALYSGAVLFVYPSLYEGFGLPPLEAMACATSVITSNTTSLPEVVGDAALSVDPVDINAIAWAMRRLVEDNTLRAELRSKGLDRARQFTWERTAELTWKVLTDSSRH